MTTGNETVENGPGDVGLVTILLAEDDPGHARLITKNLRRAKCLNDIVVAENGREALDYLYGTGKYEGVKRPDHLVVLLDLNMPVMDGYQVLEKMKADPETKSVPVVVLTTTDSPVEIERCYALGCNVYITKPVEYEDFSNAVRQLGMFLSVVTVPEREGAGPQ